MKVYANTDIGKARETNQDYYYISKDTDKLNLYILADGMGGYNGGEVASELTTKLVKEYIENNFNKVENKETLIIDAIENANVIIYEKSKQDKELEGMGTTLEICLIYNNKVYIGHVGDSGVYEIKKDYIQKITKDHSYVEDLIKDGTITREESKFHPKKHVITKAIGCETKVEPDVIVRELSEHSILCMCSDGLTNMLNDEEILTEIENNIENCTSNLIKKANNLGGYDNITIIIIDTLV